MSTEQRAVPRDRLAQRFVTVVCNTPLERVPRLRRRQILIANFAARGVSNVRLQVRFHETPDRSGHVQRREWRLVAEVERLAAHTRITGPLAQEHIGTRDVFHVDVVAAKGPVTAHDGSLAAQHGSNGAGTNATPVQVAAAVDVSAPRDGDRYTVAVAVRRCDQIRAALRDFVRVSTLKRHRFDIRQRVDFPVGLVAGGHDHAANERRMNATRLEEVVRAADVRLECREWIAVCHADNRLRGDLMHKLLETHQFEVPESLVNHQTQYRLESVVRDMIGRGIDPRSQELNWEGAREELKGQAEEDVRGSMLLERIAEEEHINVSDEEIEAEIEAIAKSTRQSKEKVRGVLTKDGGERSIANRLRNRKALDLLRENARVTDEEWRDEQQELVEVDTQVEKTKSAD